MPAYKAKTSSDNRKVRKSDRSSTFIANRNMAKKARKAARLARQEAANND